MTTFQSARIDTMNLYFKYLLLISWMIVIFFLSNEVAGTSSGRSDAIADILANSLNINLPQEVLTFLTRKAAHIIAYFILGILAFNVIQTYKLSTKGTLVLSIAFALLYAVSDEVHQLFVPGRSGEIRDVIIDTTAATVGVFFYYFVNKKYFNRINSKNDV